jgi:hypothetical protein
MTRTPWHWSRRRVLLVAGFLVIAVGTSVAATGVIPWLNRRPVEVNAPPLAPPCRAENLRVLLRYDITLNGLTGTELLINKSSRACSLLGRPRLALVDPRVRKPDLHVEFTPPAPPKPGAVDLAPLSLLRAIPPHRGAYVHFTWKNWCESGPPPAGLELRLPSGDRVVRSFSASGPRANGLPPLYSSTSPRCQRKRSQTGLYYEGFYPDWIPASLSSKYQLDATLPLRASIVKRGLPTIRKKTGHWPYATYIRVKRGSAFHYSVALRNTSKLPFRFKRCPLYAESVAGLASNPPTQDIFVLNCRPVGIMAPGQTKVFAMEVLVAKDAPLGWNLMTWNLYSRGPGFAVPVWIVP